MCLERGLGLLPGEVPGCPRCVLGPLLAGTVGPTGPFIVGTWDALVQWLLSPELDPGGPVELHLGPGGSRELGLQVWRLRLPWGVYPRHERRVLDLLVCPSVSGTLEGTDAPSSSSLHPVFPAEGKGAGARLQRGVQVGKAQESCWN